MRWSLGLVFALAAFAQTPQNFYWIGGPVNGSSNLTTVGAVPYVSAAGTLNQDAASFFWDSTNKRLGIGTNSPNQALQVGAGNNIQFWADGGGVNVAATGTPFSFGHTGNNWVYLTNNGSGSSAAGISLTINNRNVIVCPSPTDGNYKFDVQCSGSTGTLKVKDQTATTGFTRVLFDLGAADTSSTEIFRINGAMRFGGSNSTGAGSAALGANSPAVTNTAPYTWVKVITSDGSVAYFPVWK